MAFEWNMHCSEFAFSTAESQYCIKSNWVVHIILCMAGTFCFPLPCRLLLAFFCASNWYDELCSVCQSHSTKHTCAQVMESTSPLTRMKVVGAVPHCCSPAHRLQLAEPSIWFRKLVGKRGPILLSASQALRIERESKCAVALRNVQHAFPLSIRYMWQDNSERERSHTHTRTNGKQRR